MLSLKKFLTTSLIIVFLLAVALLTPPLTLAQFNPLNPITAGLSLGMFAGKQIDTVIEVASCQDSSEVTLACFVFNIIDINEDITGDKIGLKFDEGGLGESGLLPGLTTTIASLYQPPVNTGQYLAYLGRHLVPTASAQGAGYRGLSPIIGVWSTFRNLAYFFFVIIFIVIGFMIMFRTKINPQTVISIQTALPRLVVTLVLITFSYAIAGFLIDLIYFLTLLGINLFYATSNQANQVTEVFTGQGLVKLFLTEIYNPFDLPTTRGNQTSIVGSYSAAIGNSIQGLLGDLVGTSLGAVGWLSSKLVMILVSLIIIFVLLRLMVILLTAFVTIILSVIFAPLLLTFNALPGSNAFTNWLKNLFANILIFPAVAMFIVISGLIVGSPTFGLEGVGYSSTTGSTGFVPPLLGPTLADPNVLQATIGLGLLLLLPSVAQMIKDALKVEPFKYTKDLAAAGATALWPFKRLYAQQRERQAELKQEQILRSALSGSRG